MKTTISAITTMVLALGLAVPFARADWDDYNRARAELEKDRRQYHEARREGSRKGMENERREIEEDLRALRRHQAELSHDRRYDRYGYGWGRGYDGDYYRRHDRYDGRYSHPSYGRGRGNHYGWYKHKHKHHRHHDDD